MATIEHRTPRGKWGKTKPLGALEPVASMHDPDTGRMTSLGLYDVTRDVCVTLTAAEVQAIAKYTAGLKERGHCQFVVEWPKEAEELRNAREALHATLPALIRLGDFVGNVDEGGASNQGRIDRCALILQVRAALARTPAPVAKAEGTAVCGVCNRACARESVQFHQGRFVGPCCWDERLRTTE